MKNEKLSEKNIKISIRLLHWVARMGYVDAQYDLALMYLHGVCLESNNDIFEYWAYAAYEQGHIGAIYELAKHYRLLGAGGKQLSTDKFIKYVDLAYEQLEIAADSGMLDAQVMLADMHRIGEGTGVPDWDMAIFWYNEAASMGSRSAQEMRDYMITSLGLSEWLPESL